MGAVMVDAAPTGKLLRYVAAHGIGLAMVAHYAQVPWSEVRRIAWRGGAVDVATCDAIHSALAEWIKS